MKGIIKILGLFILAIGLVNCQANMENSGPSKEEVKEAIEAQNKEFMSIIADQDTASLNNIYAEGAILYPNQAPPAEGKGEIKEFFQHTFGLGVTKADFITVEVHVHKGAAVEIGEYLLYSDENQIDEGSYMIYWKKSGDTWKIYRDIFNTDMAPPQQEE